MAKGSWKELREKDKTMLKFGFDHCECCLSYKPIMRKDGLCFRCETEALQTTNRPRFSRSGPS
jgi:hypothetical protein